MSSDQESKLKDILSQVLLIDQKEISDELSRRDVEEWDSWCHLVLITELESAFGIEISDDDISAIKTVGDIKKVLRKLGVALEANTSP